MQVGQRGSTVEKQKIIVTGCLAQRYAEDLAAEMPEVDVVMGFEEYKNLPGGARAARWACPPSRVATASDGGNKRGRVRVGTARPRRSARKQLQEAAHA